MHIRSKGTPERLLWAQVTILLLPVSPVEGQGGDAKCLKGSREGTQDPIDDVCNHGIGCQ